LAAPRLAVAATVAASVASPAAATLFAVLALQSVSRNPTEKRSSGEQQWCLAKQTRKAAKRRLDETASAVQELAVERDAAVKRFDSQEAAAEATFKDAKRRMRRSQEAMQSLSEVLFDVEE